MRIVVTAYAFEPDAGSEAGSAWRLCAELAKDHEIHVLTQQKCQVRIEEALRAQPALRLQVHYVASRESRIPLIDWLRYYLWQLRAGWRAAELHRRYRFTLGHALTYGTWRVPPFLWLAGIPYVWGPFGGGQRTPPGFRNTLGFRGAVWDVFRELCQFLSRLDPLVRLGVSKASVLLCVNQGTRDVVPRKQRHKVRMMLDPVIDLPTVGAGRTSSEEIVVAWAGRMVAWKGLPLLLEAAPLLPADLRVRILVYGEGPDRARCQAMAHPRVSFMGQVAGEERHRIFDGADIFVFTSLHESTGTAQMEARAAGLPVILLDWAAGREVPEGVVMKLRVTNPQQVSRDLAGAIEALASDREGGLSLGAAAREEIRRNHTAPQRAKQLMAIYEEILGSRAYLPALGDAP